MAAKWAERLERDHRPSKTRHSEKIDAFLDPANGQLQNVTLRAHQLEGLRWLVGRLE
jgi:hypothetical protein